LSIVHVFDLVDAIVESLESDHTSGAVFPIDDGDDYTWEELGREIGEPMGKEPKPLCIPGLFFEAGARLNEFWGQVTDQAVIFTRDKLKEMKQDHWVCGHRELTDQLGWTPDWPLDRGARQTYEWYREHEWL